MLLSNAQTLVDRLARKRKKLIRLVIAANAAVALLLSLLVFLVLSTSKQSYEEQAKSAAEGIAAIAQTSIGSELNQADTVISTTAEELQRLQPGQAPDALINEVLASRLHLMKGVEAFRLTDSSARVRWGNALPTGSPMVISDREYFHKAREELGQRSVVSGPLRSRVSGNWIVGFARPIRIDGTFNGVLYVSVRADHFKELFSRYELEEGDAITLRGNDLRLVARHSPGSDAEVAVGTTNVSDALRIAMQSEPGGGSFISKAAFDGELRTTAYRAVEGWPFTAYAGVSHARFLRAWQQQAAQVSLLAVLSWALVALATLLMYRASAREASAMQALADQSQRTQTLLRVAGDGIHILDHRGRLVDMSDSFAEMLQHSRQELMGKHVSFWDANQNDERIAMWLAAIKDKDQQRVDVQHRRKDGSIIDVELQMRVTRLVANC